jgi:hypothetical protein
MQPDGHTRIYTTLTDATGNPAFNLAQAFSHRRLTDQLSTWELSCASSASVSFPFAAVPTGQRRRNRAIHPVPARRLQPDRLDLIECPGIECGQQSDLPSRCDRREALLAQYRLIRSP